MERDSPHSPVTQEWQQPGVVDDIDASADLALKPRNEDEGVNKVWEVAEERGEQGFALSFSCDEDVVVAGISLSRIPAEGLA